MTAGSSLPTFVPSFMPPLTFVVGGSRSGKSAYAESLLTGHGAEVVYLATAEVSTEDVEMVERIRLHRERRGSLWRTVEEPFDLPAVLARAPLGAPVLIDCLTLWLSNLMLADRNLNDSTEALLAALRQPRGPVIAVATEVGFGIVPDNALARAFRDHAGILNQRIAAVASRVVLVVAGLPVTLKDAPSLAGNVNLSEIL